MALLRNSLILNPILNKRRVFTIAITYRALCNNNLQALFLNSHPWVSILVPNILNPQLPRLRARVRLLQRLLCPDRRLEAPSENSAWKGRLG